MALQAVLDNLDGLSDAVRSEYRPGSKDEGLEGKFVLDVVAHSSGFALENVVGLKNTVGHLRSELNSAKKGLEGFGEVTPDKVQALQAELEGLKKVGKDAQGQIKAQVDAQIAEVKKNLETEKQKLQDQLKGRDRTIEQLVVDNAARAAILEEGGNVDFLLHHVKQQTAVEWVSGPNGEQMPVARVLADNSKPDSPQFRITMEQGKTDPMGIHEFVKTMKGTDRFKPAFKSDAPGGTNSQGSTPGQNGSGQDLSKLSPTEKIAIGLSSGRR